MCPRAPRVWRRQEPFPHFLQRWEKPFLWKRPRQAGEHEPRPHAASGVFSSLRSVRATFPLGWPAGCLRNRHLPGATDLHSRPGNHGTVTGMTGRPRATPGSFVRRHPARNAGSRAGRELGGGVKVLGGPPGEKTALRWVLPPSRAPRRRQSHRWQQHRLLLLVQAGKLLHPRRATVTDSCVRELSV